MQTTLRTPELPCHRKGPQPNQFEVAEAQNAIACAVARKRWYGDLTTDVLVNAAGVTIFAGHWTHLTQTVALTLSALNAEASLREIEEFCASYLAVPTLHVCNTDRDLEDVLTSRGYRRVGKAHILNRDATGIPVDSGVAVREIGTNEVPAWRRTIVQALAACGRDGAREAAGVVAGMPHAKLFLASVDGLGACGAAAMATYGNVAIVFCDGTIPRARSMGVQRALIAHRIAAAQELGCAYVSVLVDPGTTSERNYLHSGFRTRYERHTWQRDGVDFLTRSPTRTS